MDISNSLSGRCSTGLPAAGSDAQKLVDNMTVYLDIALADEKLLLDSYRVQEKVCELDKKEMGEKLISMEKEDRRLNAIDHMFPFAIVPGSLIAAIGAMVQNPIVLAVSGAVVLGSLLAKVYSKIRSPKLDQEAFDLTKNADINLQYYRDLHNNMQGAELKVADLEARAAKAHHDAEQTRDMVGILNSDRLSGASEIVDTKDYLDIEGIKLKKRSDREQVAFDLAQTRIKLKDSRNRQ